MNKSRIHDISKKVKTVKKGIEVPHVDGGHVRYLSRMKGHENSSKKLNELPIAKI